MSLPTIECPTADVTLSDGSVVTVRGLRRKEFLGLTKLGEDENERGDALALHWGVDIASEAAAQAWLDDAPMGDAAALLEKIMELSGLGDDAPKG